MNEKFNKPQENLVKERQWRSIFAPRKKKLKGKKGTDQRSGLEGRREELFSRL